MGDGQKKNKKNRLVSLFDKADLPVPAKCDDDHMHTHEYRPPVTKGVKDSRSPCPALNTLANHGYLFVQSPLPDFFLLL